jgi:hypothetical protein
MYGRLMEKMSVDEADTSQKLSSLDEVIESLGDQEAFDDAIDRLAPKYPSFAELAERVRANTVRAYAAFDDALAELAHKYPDPQDEVRQRWQARFDHAREKEERSHREWLIAVAGLVHMNAWGDREVAKSRRAEELTFENYCRETGVPTGKPH